MRDHIFSCDTEPTDTVAVEVGNPAAYYGEVWVRLVQGGAVGVVMLKPKKARKLAKALHRAATIARANR